MILTDSTILVVDDDPMNRELLVLCLEDAGYHTVEAADGLQAWTILQETPEDFSAILLDRMMPRLNGMEVLARLKAHQSLKMIPVIMQTGATSTQEILEGLQAGAYYYLAKPFDKTLLLSIVRKAVIDWTHYKALQEEIQGTLTALTLIQTGRFQFRTLMEARNLAALLANACPDPPKAGAGLIELLINAVEHGNLGITFEEKSALLATERWEQEVARRLASPEYGSRYVTVTFERRPESVRFIIQDQGAGFNSHSYLALSPERAFQVHGRGIATAKALCFDELHYRGNGNEVEVISYTRSTQDEAEAMVSACTNETREVPR